MAVEVEATIAGLTRLEVLLNTATRDIVNDGSKLIQLNARFATPIGEPGNTTNAPGELRESIVTAGPTGGGGRWESRVLTDLVYSWQREAGGVIEAQSASWLVFHWGDRGWVHAHSVSQEGAHYMENGRDRSIPGIYRLAVTHVRRAIAGV